MQQNHGVLSIFPYFPTRSGRRCAKTTIFAIIAVLCTFCTVAALAMEVGDVYENYTIGDVTYDRVTVEQKPNCGTNQPAKYWTLKDGAEVEVVVPAEHDYAIIETNPASCTAAGTAQYKCTICGKIKTDDDGQPVIANL